jgi:hypothetical protein
MTNNNAPANSSESSDVITVAHHLQNIANKIAVPREQYVL